MAALHVINEREFTTQVLSNDVIGLGVDDVDVDFSLKYNMRVDDPSVGDLIDQTWAKRSAENPLIFDGQKFRVHEIVVDHESKRPLFRLGLTSYREYLGTNCSDRASNLRDRGLSEHGNPQIYLSDPLGVGAFVLTTDNKFVLLKRSHLCSEAQGLLDGPGGHAEPHMVSGLLDKPEVDSFTRKAIRNEIFNSIIREIVDEVNIRERFLSEPKLLGAVYNHTTAWRCSLQFIVKCQLQSDEIVKNFKLGGHSEASESTDCIVINETTAIDTTPSGLWKQLAPATKGAIAIYRLLKENEMKIK